MNTRADTRQVMPPETFAGLGSGRIAYVRAMTSDALKAAFPNAPALQPGLDLWALCGADGTPLMVADSREAVVANAFEHDIQTVSVH